LLTGEYLVLDSALALGLPTKKGQYLSINKKTEPVLEWRSKDYNDEIWFQMNFQLPLSSQEFENPVAKVLFQILSEAKLLNPNFLKEEKDGFAVSTYLEFDKDWGLGSSSTLINNIAQWAEVDAFTLLQRTMGGSGYDIACAQHDSALLYQLVDQKPVVQAVNFNPDFSKRLFFIHLNSKQRSHREISRYNALKTGVKEAVKTVSEITNLVLKASKIDDFELLIKEHEAVLSSVLETPPVQKALFKDYFGQLKSLGAWGGDFILATGNEDTPRYFEKKGFTTVLSYDDMLLTTKHNNHEKRH